MRSLGAAPARVAFLCLLVHGALAQVTVPDTEALRRAVDRNPTDAEARRQLGLAYFRDRQSKLALDQYQEALRLEPLNENLYLEASTIFLSAGLAEQAETVLSEAARRFPDSRSAGYNRLYHDLAELWAASGRLRKARELMNMAVLREGPVAPATLYKRIGDFSTDLLRFDDALSAYQRVLEFDRKNTAVHLALGNLHLQRNSPSEALEVFTRVISVEPRNSGALYGIAEAHRRSGRLEEAVAAAGRVLEINPEHQGARYIRGTALVRMDRADEGQRELQEYRRLQARTEAENHRLREIQTFKTSGMARLLQGQYDEAIAIFKKGIAAYPDVPEFYVNLGLAQSQSGQHRAAVATFLVLLDRKLGAETLVHRYLAQEYLSLGQEEASKRHQAIYVQKRKAELGGGPPE